MRSRCETALQTVVFQGRVKPTLEGGFLRMRLIQLGATGIGKYCRAEHNGLGF